MRPIELRSPCSAQAQGVHPWPPVRRMRRIALRSPCSAQAQGVHPWPPVRRMRRTPTELNGAGRCLAPPARHGDRLIVEPARTDDSTEPHVAIGKWGDSMAERCQPIDTRVALLDEQCTVLASPAWPRDCLRKTHLLPVNRHENL